MISIRIGVVLLMMCVMDNKMFDMMFGIVIGVMICMIVFYFGMFNV